MECVSFVGSHVGSAATAAPGSCAVFAKETAQGGSAPTVKEVAAFLHASLVQRERGKKWNCLVEVWGFQVIAVTSEVQEGRVGKTRAESTLRVQLDLTQSGDTDADWWSGAQDRPGHRPGPPDPESTSFSFYR